MRSVCRQFFVTACILSIFQGNTFGQLNTSKYEIGVNLGTLIYQGDLSKSFKGEYRSLKPALGIYVNRVLDPYFAVRAGLTIGKVGADETAYTTPEWKQMRGFKFNTSITELTASLLFNPFGENNDNAHRLSPYVFAGAGVTFLNVRRDWSNLNRSFYDSKSDVQVGLVTDSAHATPKVIPVLPVGAGLRFAIGAQFSLHAEATYRFTATDYLDGFKYSANPKKMDRYYGISVGLSYRPGGYKCPRVGK